MSNLLYNVATVIETRKSKDGKRRTAKMAVNKVLKNGMYGRIHFDTENLRTDDYVKNPLLLQDHNRSVDYIIGKVNTLTKTDKSMDIDFEFAGNKRGRNVELLWDGDFVRGISYGYAADSIDYEYDKEEDILNMYIPAAELVEVSIVTTPRDPDALKNDIEEMYHKHKDIANNTVNWDKFIAFKRWR